MNVVNFSGDTVKINKIVSPANVVLGVATARRKLSAASHHEARLEV